VLNFKLFYSITYILRFGKWFLREESDVGETFAKVSPTPLSKSFGEKDWAGSRVVLCALFSLDDDLTCRLRRHPPTGEGLLNLSLPTTDRKLDFL
jgi:hypothetical protein